MHQGQHPRTHNLPVCLMPRLTAISRFHVEASCQIWVMSKAPCLSILSKECLSYDRNFTRLSEGFKRATFARAPKPFEPALTTTKADRGTAAAWSISGGNSGSLPPNNGLRHLYEDSGDDQGRKGNISLQESADIGHGN